MRTKNSDAAEQEEAFLRAGGFIPDDSRQVDGRHAWWRRPNWPVYSGHPGDPETPGLSAEPEWISRAAAVGVLRAERLQLRRSAMLEAYISRLPKVVTSKGAAEQVAAYFDELWPDCAVQR